MATKDEKMPTFDEFKKAVKEDYLHMDNSKVSRNYFNSDEAQKKIQRDYTSYAKRYEKGEINRTVFMKGGVSAVSNCLNLMME
ncbi:hypothetical protein II906_03545 [bacterium]|nr:hypothetical protein [bacterium]